MKLKDVDPVEVIITTNGKIGIRQDSNDYDSDCVFITLDQFLKIENWVFKNKEEIELAWNDGLENE
jgi:hypothetical protein